MNPLKSRRAVLGAGLQLGAAIAIAAPMAGCAARATAAAGAAVAGAVPRPVGPEVSAPAPQQMVDALHTAFGDHHVRAVHAKGVMAVGVFEPKPAAAALCRAPLFRTHGVPVLLRFSDFTGIPDIPDTVGDANPRGMAIKFSIGDGSTMDIVTHSFNGFPTATSGEFRELLLAIGASGPGASRPNALERFLEIHPIAKTFLTTQKPPSVSYATLSYFGVNAFRFTSARDEISFVRYQFVPVAGEEFLTAQALAQAGPNYLGEELPHRLAHGPVVYRWLAQIAERGDNVEDPSVAWPATRQLVELGAIRIAGMAPDPANLDRGSLFRPLNVPEGIDGADPMLAVRNSAYPLSFRHRQ